MANYVDITPRTFNSSLVGYNLDEDLEAVKNSLRNLFTIQKGEVPGKPWLGNPLNIFLFDNIGFFEEKSMEVAIRNVLKKYETRVELISVKINSQPEYNSIGIILNYIVFMNDQEVFQSTSIALAHNSMTNIQTRINK